MTYEEMDIGRYDAVMELLRSLPGVCLRDADSREAVQAYLERNPGMSFLAIDDGRVVGCAMGGHDGRRGYLNHVAVHPSFRRQGLAKALVSLCLERLAKDGIDKTHIDVLVSNEQGRLFWESLGWRLRDDVVRYSFIRSGKESS